MLVVVAVVVVWRTYRGGSVPRVSTERSLGGGSGDLEVGCTEAVLSRGRGPGIQNIPTYLIYYQTHS